MLALARDQAMAQIVELNQRFHGLLIDRAGNPALASALTAVTHAAVVRRNFQHYSPGALARSLAHHLEIVAAARAGEPDWAEAVMRSHLYNARATMLSDQAEADQ
jgi:DNA-binding GntR family transcriptional regulator